MEMDFPRIKMMAGDGRDVKDYISKLLDPQDPPYLSSCMAATTQGGVYVMQALEARYLGDRDMPPEGRIRWTLRVLSDEWGRPVVPGQTIIRKVQLPLEHGPGKPLTSEEINIDKMDGVYDKKWLRKIPYIVDEKGCITCEYQDAVYFLRSFGVHGKSGARMSMHVNSTSGDPVKTPDGQMCHVHYWRYKEVDADEYAALPVLTPKKNLPARKGNKE